MKILIFIFLISFNLNAQWLGGAGYQQKSSLPEKGAGLIIINKLPVQFPAIGFNLKAKVNYFFSGATPVNYFGRSNSSFKEYSADIFLETNFFSRLFQPYISMGLGGGIITSPEIERGFFALNGDAGIKINYNIQPFLGLQVRKIFPEIVVSNVEIKSYQLMGIIGVLVSI